MKKLREISSDATSDLMAYPHHTWCCAYFSARSKSWAVDNNFTKSFYAWIIDPRYRPIRSMMEVIKRKTMNMLGIMGPTCEKWINEFSPSCNEVFQINNELVIGCVVLFNGDTRHEIREGENTHTFFLNANLAYVGDRIIGESPVNMLFVHCYITKKIQWITSPNGFIRHHGRLLIRIRLCLLEVKGFIDSKTIPHSLFQR